MSGGRRRCRRGCVASWQAGDEFDVEVEEYRNARQNDGSQKRALRRRTHPD